jgi:hypothetical protein
MKRQLPFNGLYSVPEERILQHSFGFTIIVKIEKKNTNL